MTDPIDNNRQIRVGGPGGPEQTQGAGRVRAGKTDGKVTVKTTEKLVEVEKKSLLDRGSFDKKTTRLVYQKLGDLMHGDVEEQGEMTDAQTKEALKLISQLVHPNQEPEHLEFAKVTAEEILHAESPSKEVKAMALEIFNKIVDIL